MSDLERLRELVAAPLRGSYPLPPSEDEPTFRARAMQALESLGARGALDLVDSEGGTLGGALLRVFDEPLAPFLEERPGKVQLASELARNVHDPGRINQGLKGTCAVTCVESYLAGAEPAEYARLLVGLMSPDGEVRLRDGELFARDEQLLRWSDREARRSPVSRLFQVSAMENAYPELDYRNTWDAFVDADRDSVAPPGQGLVRPPGLEPTGLSLDAFDRFLEGVTGERWDTLSEKEAHIARLLEKMGLDTSGAPELRRDGLGIVRRSAVASEPTFVTLDVAGHPGAGLDPSEDGDGVGALALHHKVRVLDVDEQSHRVVYEDPLDPVQPWLPGIETRIEDLLGRCSMGQGDFERLMLELSYKPRFWSPSEE